MSSDDGNAFLMVGMHPPPDPSVMRWRCTVDLKMNVQRAQLPLSVAAACDVWYLRYGSSPQDAQALVNDKDAAVLLKPLVDACMLEAWYDFAEDKLTLQLTEKE